MKLHHPTSDDLAFLYGTILTDGKDNYSSDATANVCVFAEAQVSYHFVTLRRAVGTEQTLAVGFTSIIWL